MPASGGDVAQHADGFAGTKGEHQLGEAEDARQPAASGRYGEGNELMRVAGMRDREIRRQQIVLLAVRHDDPYCDAAEVTLVVVARGTRGIGESHDGRIGGAGFGISRN